MEQAQHRPLPAQPAKKAQRLLPAQPVAERPLLAEPAPPDYSTPEGMRREEFRAMGTTISMLLPEKQAERGKQIVYMLFLEWEQVLSRFLPESELSRLNKQTGKPIVVSNLLYTVLVAALKAARATEGVYDPALLDQLVQLGYDRTFDDLAQVQSNSITPRETGGGWRDIEVSPISRCVVLPVGIKLDFGGIAKGMAVDAALEQLSQHGISPALVNAGGDLGVIGLPALAEQWPIAVPGRKGFWTIPLRQGAVATSGIAHHHWWQGETLRHHLLDPHTGLPAQSDLWSVTVVTDWCEQAEVAAKVAFILGAKSGAAFLRRQAIAGLFVHKDGTWETTEPWPTHIMGEESRGRTKWTGGTSRHAPETWS